jgi:hypothetical protein
MKKLDKLRTPGIKDVSGRKTIQFYHTIFNHPNPKTIPEYPITFHTDFPALIFDF